LNLVLRECASEEALAKQEVLKRKVKSLKEMEAPRGVPYVPREGFDLDGDEVDNDDDTRSIATAIPMN